VQGWHRCHNKVHVQWQTRCFDDSFYRAWEHACARSVLIVLVHTPSWPHICDLFSAEVCMSRRKCNCRHTGCGHPVWYAATYVAAVLQCCFADAAMFFCCLPVTCLQVTVIVPCAPTYKPSGLHQVWAAAPAAVPRLTTGCLVLPVLLYR